MTTLSSTHIRAFMNLASALSPENLHWDGERSRSAAATARRRIMNRWRELEVEVGRPVSEDEVLLAFLSATRSASASASGPRGSGSTEHFE